MDLGNVDKALYNLLVADATLQAMLGVSGNVFNGAIPSEATLPAVEFSLVSSVEDTEAPRAADVVYQVKAVAERLATSGADYGASDIAARVDALLYHTELSVTGMTNYLTVCLSHFRYKENTGAQQAYWHVGGRYLLKLEG